MKIKVWIAMAFLAVLVGLMPAYDSFRDVATVMKLTAETNKELTMVIDPGHGGIDGGACSGDVLEKDINLRIALALRSEAEKYGVKVLMTRETDIGLYGEGNSVRGKKIEDLQNRKKLIDEFSPDITVSIHLNNFLQDETVRSTQVFFPKEAEDPLILEASETIAKMVNESVETAIPDGKKREVMKKGDLFIFRNIHTPIILIECGFLSNSDDKKSLINPVFQEKMAAAVMKGIGEYFGVKMNKNIPVIDSSICSSCFR